MPQLGRAFGSWSMSRWLEGRHPDPFEGDFPRVSLTEVSRSYAHGLRSHHSWSVKMCGMECQAIYGTLG